ncbi:hypothetical protein ABH985_007089 [Bradyrhizobium ottawaense]
MARAIESICFCPPERLPRPRQPEPAQRREETKNPVELGVVERAVARRQHQVFLHGEIGEYRHALRHVADAEPCDVRRRAALDAIAGEADLAAGRLPQSHDGAQRRGLAGAVAPEQHRGLPLRDREVDALEDVIAADMGVDA